MPALFTIENGTRTGQAIEKRPCAALAPGDVARGIVDGKPITGRPCTIVDIARGSARRNRVSRRVPLYRVAYVLPNGSAGVKFLTADQPVSVEVAR